MRKISAASHIITIQHDVMQNYATPAADPAIAIPSAPTSEHDADGQSVIQEYGQGIDTLRGFLDAKHPMDDGTLEKLEKFKSFVSNGLNGHFSAPVRAHYMTQVRGDFHLFCTLVQAKTLPEETRRQTIQNLANSLNVCTSGIAQHIEAAARELNAFAKGIAQNFTNQLILSIEQKSLAVIKDNNICQHSGNEIHYVAALFNHVAPYFGLPPRTDEFIKVIPWLGLNACVENILNTVTAENVIKNMADDYLLRIQTFYENKGKKIKNAAFDENQLSEMLQDFQENLQLELESIFGSIGHEILFPACEGEGEFYRLIDDSTLIAHSLARNLRKTGVVNFKAKYAYGKNGDGIKIKQLGETIRYVSETDKSKGINHLRTSLEQFQKLRYSLAEKDMAMSAEEWKEFSASFAIEIKAASEKVDEQLDIQNRYDNIAMILAPAYKQSDIAAKLIEKMSVERLGLKDERGNTALMIAVADNQSDIGIKLIERQFGFRYKYDITALALALACKQSDIAAKLIEKMSVEQLGLQNKYGNTALMLALEYQYEYEYEYDYKCEYKPAIAAKLIEKMSVEQLGLKSDGGDTALSIAIKTEQLVLANAIIAKMSPEQRQDAKALKKLLYFPAIPMLWLPGKSFFASLFQWFKLLWSL